LLSGSIFQITTGSDNRSKVEWLLKTPWTLAYFTSAGNLANQLRQDSRLRSACSSSSATEIKTCGTVRFPFGAVLVQGVLWISREVD
jgi:hypothetical protein